MSLIGKENEDWYEAGRRSADAMIRRFQPVKTPDEGTGPYRITEPQYLPQYNPEYQCVIYFHDTIYATLQGRTREEAQKNADRLVASLTFCEGLPIEKLSELKNFKEWATDMCLFLERHLQKLHHRDNTTRYPHIDKPSGYAVAEIPDWEIRQKLDMIGKTLDGDKTI